MDDDTPLSLEDARTIVRIVSQTLSTTAGPAAQKRALATALAAAVEADHWIWVVSRVGDDHVPTWLNVLHSDLDDATVATFMHATLNTEHPPPENPAFAAEIATGRHFTRTRDQFVDDDTWSNDEHVRRFRHPCDFDEFMYSCYPLEPGMFSGVGLHRRRGRPGFTARERRIAHIILSEIGPLHRAGAPDLDKGERVPDLSPRHRTVFGLLVEGFSRQQIAHHLDLSPFTIADYMKSIYKHFGVTSQPELIRRFMAGNGGDIAQIHVRTPTAQTAPPRPTRPTPPGRRRS